MNEADYLNVSAPKGKRYTYLTKYEVGMIIEEYVTNKVNNLERIAVKYRTSVTTVSQIITDVLFPNPKDPITITLKSKV
jgi:hypothetical protein